MQGVIDVSSQVLQREKSNYEAFIGKLTHQTETADSVMAVRALVLACSPCLAFNLCKILWGAGAYMTWSFSYYYSVIYFYVR